MRIPDMSGKNFARLKFIGFFGASVFLCVIILSSFWSTNSSTPPQELKEIISPDTYGASQLLEINQALHSKWIELELLYDENALAKADPSKLNVSSQLGTQIAEMENAYAKTLDSVAATNAASSAVEKIDSVVNTFRASLQNKQALNNNLSELALTGGNSEANTKTQNNTVPDKKLSALQSDLVAKNDVIAKLQTEVASTSALKKTLTASDQKLSQLENDVKLKNEMITKLQSQVNSVSAKSSSSAVNEQKVRQMQIELQAKTDMISKLQSEVSSASGKVTGVAASEQKLRQLQNDLRAKTEMVSNLQGQLKATPIKNNSASDAKKLNEMQKELQSKTALIAKLQGQVKGLPAKAASHDDAQPSGDVKKMKDELEFLKWALRSEVSSNHALTDNVNKLKQANATLSNQLKGK